MIRARRRSELDEPETAVTPTVVTFDPHPRTAFGNRVALLSTLERRLELLAECGIEDTLVVEFTPELASRAAGGLRARLPRPRSGPRSSSPERASASGASARATATCCATLGFDAREVPLVEGISSTKIRQLALAGEVEAAARLLGRPLEVDGTVVTGDHRGGTLGFPTANLLVEPDMLVPEFGIYAGAVGDKRAAISIGVNPHYGGTERRVEAYLLDWTGDLYGDRLVVELWQRLREERAFESEAELVAQIARDVEETRSAVRPI